MQKLVPLILRVAVVIVFDPVASPHFSSLYVSRFSFKCDKVQSELIYVRTLLKLNFASIGKTKQSVE